MKVFIPEMLDVRRLIKSKPPTEITNFSKDKMLYIVGSIAYLQTYRDNLKVGGNYVPLNSTYLQRFAGIKDYNRYLDYLERVGVVAAIKSTVKGLHSRLYTFRPPYAGINMAVSLSPSKFTKALKKKDTRKTDSIKQFKNLWQWYATGNLTIDKKAAMEYLHLKYPLNMSGEIGIVTDEDGWPVEDHLHKHYRMSRIIDYIYSGKSELLHFTVDKTAGRLHTVLTNMNSDFRNFLTYGGKQLVSIDVKCCQPYLTLLLFNPHFYKVKTRGLPVTERRILNNLMKDIDAGQISMPPLSCSSVSGKHVLSLMSLNAQEQGYASVFSSLSSLSSSIMLAKEIQQGIEKGLYSDVGQYMHDILVKDFYTELSNAFNKEYDENTTRDDMKEKWSMVAFGIIRGVNHVSTPDFYRFFAKRYPTVLKVYDTIKAEKHKNLAYLLQQIEAHIVLKVSSKRVTKLKPRVPLYSIHDSLVTTVDHLEFVRSVMEEELNRLIGHKPKLKVEYWSSEALLAGAEAA